LEIQEDDKLVKRRESRTDAGSLILARRRRNFALFKLVYWLYLTKT
jgi:hypothetical protein